MKIQYLESLDSVSAPWNSEDREGTGSRHPARHLQIFTEVLMTLLLGRDVVVPQSYAFDSWGFLDVAATVLNARGKKSRGEHPFRLHLHKASSLDDAVQQMLARMGDPQHPFISSAFPELNLLAKEGTQFPRNVDQFLREDFLPEDGRRDALSTVHKELSAYPKVIPNPRPNSPGMNALLARFAGGQPQVEQTARSRGDDWLEVYSALLEAITKLDPRQPEAFRQRSSLRFRTAWPNDSHGQYPAAVVGGQEVLDLVIEFVDTMYNMVVADSIGVMPTAFTTDLSRGEISLKDRGIAQTLALKSYESALAETGSHSPIEGMDSGDTNELHVEYNVDHTLSSQEVRTIIETLFASASREVEALLDLRAERTDSKGNKTPFWKGVSDLESEIARQDLDAARKALEAHLKVVGRVLGSAGVESDSGLNVKLLLGGVGALAQSSWALPSPLGPILGSVGGAAPLFEIGITQFHQHRKRHRLYRALGQVVNVRRLG